MVGLALLSILFLASPSLDEMQRYRRLEAEFFAPCGSTCLAQRVGLSFWTLDDFTTLDSGYRPAPISLTDTLDLAQFQMPVTLNGPVRDFIEFFTQRGRFIFAQWFARKGRYRALIEPILKRHGLPSELIYVCMIESGFNTNAVSHASAVGPWQFIQSTGRIYGLRNDAWIDERRDPVKATEAAARHFKDLFEEFNSWPLALAAYNAGSGNVRLAMKRVGSNDFWRLASLGALPNEAAQYVPKAMAAMVIGSNPKSFGFEGVEFKAPLDFTTVFVPGGVDTQSLARSLGLSAEDFDRYNPELLRGFTPPYGEEYPLRIPNHSLAKFQGKLSEIKKIKPTVLTEHTVRFGQSLRDIALAFKVPAWRIRALNRLGNEPLKQGQTLVIPSTLKKAFVGIPPHELVVLQDPGLTFNLPKKRPVLFPVRRSMRVDELAGFFGVSSGEIGVWNGIDPSAILVRGMAIKVYVSHDFDSKNVQLIDPSRVTTIPAGSPAAMKALVQARKTRNRAIQIKKYKVRRGDTLWKIAVRHKISVAELKAENGWGRRVRLKRGQRIRIPVQAKIRPRGKAAKRRAKVSGRGRWYTVKKGDTIWKIARRFKSSVSKIRKRNQLKNANLRIDQRIFVPR